MEEKQLAALEAKAKRIRFELLQMFGSGKYHHFGGSLSCVEIVTALYFYKMNYSFENKDSPTRDRFIMSKGHSVEGLYTILADKGFFPEEELESFSSYKSRLIGHLTVKVPGIELNTGALGHGLSCSVGMATFGKRVFVCAPAYVRMGRAAVEDIYSESKNSFVYGKANLLREGLDLTPIAAGEMVVIALKAAAETKSILTIEEHSIFGGLGSAVAEIIIQNKPVAMRIMGIPDEITIEGNSKEIFEYYNLTPKGVKKQAINLLAGI